MPEMRRTASLLLVPIALAIGIVTSSKGARPRPVPGLGMPTVLATIGEPGRRQWGMQPAFGDVDGDGRPDLAVGTLQGELRIFRNVGEGGKHAFAPPIWFREICDDGELPKG